MNLILQVFVIFAAAKVAGELCVRLGLPAIVGELLVGIAIGPHVLGWIELNQATTVLADIGIVVLLFVAGLETRLSSLLSVWRPSALASVSGMLAAGGAGYGIVVAFGCPARAAAVAAVALAASSVGIAARAFSDLGMTASRPARVVFGAAVLDDVVTLVAIPVAIGVGGSRGAGGVAVAVIGALAFVVLVSALGTPFFRRYARLLERPRLHRAPFVVSLALCLGLAALAEQIGLAALIGAFLAGMALAETSERYELDRRMEPLFDFLVPFFFVLAGARMDPGALGDAGSWFVVAFVVVTIAAKFLGPSLAAVGLPFRERMIVGAGMIPRGEVTLAVATAGLTAGRIPVAVFSVLVAAVLATSLAGPPALQAASPDRRPFARRERRDSPPEGSGSGAREDG
jgi:Kef-type K+ transport system membrane component KefB